MKLGSPPSSGAASIPWSFHTHSEYCDGDGSLDDVTASAIARSLTHLGFSSHAPLPFTTDWTIPIEQLNPYLTGVRRLQSSYDGRIELFLGAELDYIPSDEVKSFQAEHVSASAFDYFVGSVHFLGEGYPPASFDGTEAEFQRILKDDYGADIRAMSQDYYERLAAVPRMPGTIIVGHFDLIKRWNHDHAYFRGDEPWYLDLVKTALRSIAGSGIAVELNTAGWRKGLGEPYPSPRILARCRQLGIPITVSSDAHTPEQLDWGFEKAKSLLDSLDIRPVNPADLLR